MRKMQRIECDIVIAGGGPGGCTVAQDMAKAGKKVVLLEKGGDTRFMPGTPVGLFMNLEKDWTKPVTFVKRTMEGDKLIQGTGIGGGTLMYLGAAYYPNDKYWKKWGIEFTKQEIQEAAEETWVTKVPDEYVGPATRRFMEAANECDVPFTIADKHVKFEKCLSTTCERCAWGCPTGAKWTAREFADVAESHGAQIITHSKVREIIIENGKAVGVRAKGCLEKHNQEFEVRAPIVVCAAGGMGTAMILKQSGFPQAGNWLCGDPSVFVYGFLPKGQKGMGFEHPGATGTYLEEKGVVTGTVLSPFIAWHLLALEDEKLRGVSNWHRYRNVMCIYFKISDQGQGFVDGRGRVSKTYTERDRERLEYARMIGQKICIKSGCDPYDLHHTQIVLGHPSSTVRIGELLDENLEMKAVKNLYCCDVSAMPAAPGRPPAMTVVCMGKRLVNHLKKQK